MNNQPMAINGYTIHSLLGKGGMAEVYLATQDSLRRKVAIKVLLSTDDDSFNQRFINEGHIVASLNHPAIITIYDINQLADGRYYLAMEFIGGGDLAQYKGQAFDPLRALAIIKQLAEGLAVIHERGLVHRDIKPANILFRHGDNVVITDFGIPKVIGGSFNVLATDVFKLVIGQQDFQRGAVVALLLLMFWEGKYRF